MTTGHRRAAWFVRGLGIYLAIGFSMLAFQIGTMADRTGVWLGGTLLTALVVVAHEGLAWGHRREARLAAVLYVAYAVFLMLPQLAILVLGRPRAWDAFALGLLGWAMLAANWLTLRPADSAPRSVGAGDARPARSSSG